MVALLRCRHKVHIEEGGGQDSTMVRILASRLSCPGLIPCIPEEFSEEKIVDVAKVDQVFQRCFLVEIGKCFCPTFLLCCQETRVDFLHTSSFHGRH